MKINFGYFSRTLFRKLIKPITVKHALALSEIFTPQRRYTLYMPPLFNTHAKRCSSPQQSKDYPRINSTQIHRTLHKKIHAGYLNSHRSINLQKQSFGTLLASRNTYSNNIIGHCAHSFSLHHGDSYQHEIDFIVRKILSLFRHFCAAAGFIFSNTRSSLPATRVICHSSKKNGTRCVPFELKRVLRYWFRRKDHRPE